MLLVKESAHIAAGPEGKDAVALLEWAGRKCYQSECKGDPEGFIRKILFQNHHESVIEHVGWTVQFVVDRGVSHELVRHRLASFSQESTRYVDQGKRGEWTFVIPSWLENELEEGAPPSYDNVSDAAAEWLRGVQAAEDCYRRLRALGWTPEKARSVLPNSTKTELVMTCNAREWRHVFGLRAWKAHPDMVHLMQPLLEKFKERVPVLFDDLYLKLLETREDETEKKNV